MTCTEVDAVKEHPEWEGLSDPALVALARGEQRAIVTNNLRDFRRLHAELVEPGGAGHAGLVFVPTSYRVHKAHIGRVIAALETKLEELPGNVDLADGETWV